MKFEKIMLVTLMLLAVLTIGAAAASEDVASDNLTVEADDAVAVDDIEMDEGDLAVDDSVEDTAIEEDTDEVAVQDDEDLSSDVDITPVSSYVLSYAPANGDVLYNSSTLYNKIGIGVHNCTANYTLIINDEVKFNGSVGEPGYSFDINTLPLGNYTWKHSYSYIKDSEVISRNSTGYFTLTYYSIYVPKEIALGQSMLMCVSRNANGRVILSVNGAVITNETLDNFYKEDPYTYKSLFLIADPSVIEKYGKCNYTVEFIGENYPSFTKNGTFEHVYRFEAVFNEKSPVEYGAMLRASLILPGDAANNVTVSVNGKTYSMKRNSWFWFSWDDLNYGNNSISFTYEDEKYQKRVINYTVATYSEFKLYHAYYIALEEFSRVSLSLPKDASGYVHVYQKIFNQSSGDYDNITLGDVRVINGEFSYVFDSSVIQENYYGFEYVGSDYAVKKKELPLTVTPKIEVIWENNLPTALNVTLGKNTGKLYVSIDKWYDNPEDRITDKGLIRAVLFNQTASGNIYIPLNDLNVGVYEVLYKFENDNCHISPDYFEFTIPGSAKITSDVSSIVYGFGSYSVTFFNKYGAVVPEVLMSVKVNGKSIGNVVTNAKGVATIKLDYAPGTYTVTVAAGPTSLTKKVTIKHALTLTTAKVKKSAKKLVLKATLKNGKKAVKGKRITFKFNGKVYKATTDKNGVAKVTIKKAVLKKLKVGKKVTYMATYLKDTVKKTAKVKK